MSSIYEEYSELLREWKRFYASLGTRHLGLWLRHPAFSDSGNVDRRLVGQSLCEIQIPIRPDGKATTACGVYANGYRITASHRKRLSELCAESGVLLPVDYADLTHSYVGATDNAVSRWIALLLIPEQITANAVRNVADETTGEIVPQWFSPDEQYFGNVVPASIRLIENSGLSTEQPRAASWLLAGASCDENPSRDTSAVRSTGNQGTSTTVLREWRVGNQDDSAGGIRLPTRQFWDKASRNQKAMMQLLLNAPSYRVRRKVFEATEGCFGIENPQSGTVQRAINRLNDVLRLTTNGWFVERSSNLDSPTAEVWLESPNPHKDNPGQK